jgi:hypothetical protein
MPYAESRSAMFGKPSEIEPYIAVHGTLPRKDIEFILKFLCQNLDFAEQVVLLFVDCFGGVRPWNKLYACIVWKIL